MLVQEDGDYGLNDVNLSYERAAFLATELTGLKCFAFSPHIAPNITAKLCIVKPKTASEA